MITAALIIAACTALHYSAGKAVVRPSGKRGVLPSGKVAVANSEGNCAECISSSIHIIGGGDIFESANRVLDENWLYESGPQTYTAKTSMPTARTAGMGRWNLDGKIYIAGGSAPDGFGLIRVRVNEEYEPVTDAWATKADMPSPARSLMASMPIDNVGHVAGGSTGTVLVDCDSYDPAIDSWSSRANTPTPARYSASGVHTGFGSGDSGLMCGGNLSSTGPSVQDVDEYFDGSDSWLAQTSLPFPDRLDAGTALKYGEAFVVYGRRHPFLVTYLRDCDAYDILLFTWSSKADAPLPVRNELGIGTTCGTLICFGGRGAGSAIYQDVDEYTIGTNTWASLANFPMSARYHHATLTL